MFSSVTETISNLSVRFEVQFAEVGPFEMHLSICFYDIKLLTTEVHNWVSHLKLIFPLHTTFSRKTIVIYYKAELQTAMLVTEAARPKA